MSKGFNEKVKKAINEGRLLTRDVLRKAETEATTEKKPLVEVLIQRNHLDFDQVAKIYESEFNIKMIDLSKQKIPLDTFRMIPENVMRRYKVVPIVLQEDSLVVAMTDPFDVLIKDDLKILTGCNIKTVFGLEYQILDQIENIFTGDEEEVDASEEMDAIISEAEDNLELVESSGDDVGDLIKSVDEAPVIKITNKILLDSVKKGASDIFIEPWEKTMRIRCRVDGLLEEIKSPPKSMANPIVSRLKVMSSLDIAERRLPQDGRFKIKFQNREVDFRVSILPTSFGEKVCLRILDKTAQAQNIDKLGFQEDELTRIKASADRPHGMILVTGPTGSGKTSTLYSILNYLDSPGKNITTVEDPVEYMMSGINQVTCRDAVGLNFPTSLRAILRQDPDIVMIGEIRDFETLDVSIKAALTGHLVLSTLHTNDACSSITRMVNMGIEPFLISSSILMVSAQRLLRQLCPECKKPLKIKDEIIKKFELNKLTKEFNLFEAAGCEACRETGYQGRTVITEVLTFTDSLKGLIMESAPLSEIKKLARDEGMFTLRESGLIKAANGLTSIDEVLRVTSSDEVAPEE